MAHIDPPSELELGYSHVWNGRGRVSTTGSAMPLNMTEEEKREAGERKRRRPPIGFSSEQPHERQEAAEAGHQDRPPGR